MQENRCGLVWMWWRQGLNYKGALLSEEHQGHTKDSEDRLLLCLKKMNGENKDN